MRLCKELLILHRYNIISFISNAFDKGTELNRQCPAQTILVHFRGRWDAEGNHHIAYFFCFDIFLIKNGKPVLIKRMERSILEYLAKLVLNIRAEIAAVKTEEQRLKARRDRLSKKEKRLMKVLDRECAGEKTDLGVATFSYRKTSHVDVSDVAKAVCWPKRNKHLDCFRIPAPEVAKTDEEPV